MQARDARRRSTLPSDLRDSLAAWAASRDRAGPALLEEILAALGKLPPATAAEAAREIANRAGLHAWLSPQRSEAADRALIHMPRVAHLYVFHGRGFLRERALDAIDEPLGNAFLFTAIATRLNDWAAPVRAAAARCGARVFPRTNPAVIAQAALFLLERRRHWRRWRDEAAVLDHALTKSDVAAALADLLRTTANGPLGKILQQALRSPGMDRHLLDLATDAVQPTVRAVALRALIDGRATWSDGYHREWIDKSLGLARRVATIAGRDLARPASIEALISRAAADRSAVVRKIAADALIQHRRAGLRLPDVQQRLATDRNAAIRDRIAFLQRVSGVVTS